MITNGIGTTGVPRQPAANPLRDGGATQRRQPLTTDRSTAATPAERSKQAIAPASTQTSLPAEPPPGTDPALWSVLSSEERGYFAKIGAMGPLTYGRAMAEMRTGALPAARGGRLDVKI